MRISGQEFPERPPDLARGPDRVKKYRDIVRALEFAASSCGEVDRSLYKSIRQVQAHAMNKLAVQKAERMIGTKPSATSIGGGLLSD